MAKKQKQFLICKTSDFELNMIVLQIWDFRTCQEERLLSGHARDVLSCDWHPRLVLSISSPTLYKICYIQYTLYPVHPLCMLYFSYVLYNQKGTYHNLSNTVQNFWHTAHIVHYSYSLHIVLVLCSLHHKARSPLWKYRTSFPISLFHFPLALFCLDQKCCLSWALMCLTSVADMKIALKC